MYCTCTCLVNWNYICLMDLYLWHTRSIMGNWKPVNTPKEQALQVTVTLTQKLLWQCINSQVSSMQATQPWLPAILCPALQVCEESSGLELQQESLSTHSGERLMPCYCLPLITELSHWLDPSSQSNNDNDKIFNFAGHQEWPSSNRSNRRSLF